VPRERGIDYNEWSEKGEDKEARQNESQRRRAQIENSAVQLLRRGDRSKDRVDSARVR